MSIVLGICSIPGRAEGLERVLDSLTNQADDIFLVLNYGEHPRPQFLDKYKNVWWIIEDNRLGDAMKFASTRFGSGGYYVAWDDDLEAMPNAISTLIAGVDKYNGLVSFHGRTYLAPVTNFKKWAGAYRCLGTVSEDVHVNLIGSGCCAFHTSRLDITIGDFKSKNMADVYLSYQASLQGVPMVVLRHNANQYVRYVPPKGKTIWQSTADYSLHVEIMKKYIK